MLILTEAQRRHWTTRGWLLLHPCMASDLVLSLSDWVDEMASKGRGQDQRLLYYEHTERGKALCRIERFLDDHLPLRSLIMEGRLPLVASMLLGERAVIYKDNINYKHAGGAGYAIHQDAAASPIVHHHVTCLIAVDTMTPENGCLEFALGNLDTLLLLNESGCMDATIAATLNWTPIPIPAGGVLFFSSSVPHRSGPNRTDTQHRTIYLTYHGYSEGDLREAYYRDRERQLPKHHASGTRDTGARISTIGHFLGERVT